MGAGGVTETEVFEVIDSLVREKQEPTIKLIRDRLGSGSFATISKHLKSWKDKNEKPLIPKLPENLQRAAQGFWGFAYKEAELAFKVEREALKAEQEKWVKEKEQLVNEMEKLEIGHHSKDRRMKEILAELDRERKVHSQKDETILKISQHNSKLDAKLESTLERLSEEKSRSTRLEKDLADIAKKK